MTYVGGYLFRLLYVLKSLDFLFGLSLKHFGVIQMVESLLTERLH